MPTCTLDGRQDPPIALEMSHLASAPAANASVHFFVGDTQAHSFEPESGGGWAAPAAISALLGRVLDAEVAAFGAAGVVWTAGNNDGPHNTIFHPNLPLPALHQGNAPHYLRTCRLPSDLLLPSIPPPFILPPP